MYFSVVSIIAWHTAHLSLLYAISVGLPWLRAFSYSKTQNWCSVSLEEVISCSPPTKTSPNPGSSLSSIARELAFGTIYGEVYVQSVNKGCFKSLQRAKWMGQEPEEWPVSRQRKKKSQSMPLRGSKLPRALKLVFIIPCRIREWENTRDLELGCLERGRFKWLRALWEPCRNAFIGLS